MRRQQVSLVHQKLKKKERKTDLSSVSVFLVYLLRNFCEELIVYVIDKVTSTFLKKKRAMDKLTCIIDLQDISMANLDGAALKTILTLLQNYGLLQLDLTVVDLETSEVVQALV